MHEDVKPLGNFGHTKTEKRIVQSCAKRVVFYSQYAQHET